MIYFNIIFLLFNFYEFQIKKLIPQFPQIQEFQTKYKTLIKTISNAFSNNN